MSDLINSIRAAQVRTAEDLVLESLRDKGLLIDAPVDKAAKLEKMKRDLVHKIGVAERAAYEYFCECPVGDERIMASEVYENIRTAMRVG